MHVGCLGNVHQSFIKIFPVTVTSACSLLFTLQIHNSAHSPLKNLLTIFYQITFNVTETIKIVNADIGDNLLEVAHKNDIDLEGACKNIYIYLI